MTLPSASVFSDDADAHVDREVTDAAGNNLTFSPMVAVGPGAYEITATWQGDPSPKRVLRIPVAGLPVGTYRLYLSVPASNDLPLGYVTVVDRK